MHKGWVLINPDGSIDWQCAGEKRIDVMFAKVPAPYQFVAAEDKLRQRWKDDFEKWGYKIVRCQTIEKGKHEPT